MGVFTCNLIKSPMIGVFLLGLVFLLLNVFLWFRLKI